MSDRSREDAELEPSSNRFLEGGYAPVGEEVTATELDVSGRIPEYLDGRYLRNGANPIHVEDPAIHHWFTGDGMVHGVRVRRGRAEWYRNRWVRAGHVARALGEPPRPGPVHAGFDFPANTNVIGQAGRTFATVEGGARPYELTDELDTIGPCDFDGTLPGGYSGHPKRDPVTGEVHTVSYFFGWPDRVQYTVLGTDARIRRVVDVPVTGSPMMHDFSLTEGHVVLYDLPITLRAELAGRTNFPFGWNPDHPARVGVLPRDGEGHHVRWYDVEPCTVFHTLNAYDDGDRTILDVVRHPRQFDYDNARDDGDPTLDRWTIDHAAGKVLEERITDHPQEFPRVDDRLVGRRHRYGYSLAVSVDDGRLDWLGQGLHKHDLHRGTTQTRTFASGSYLSEFVFVPSASDAAEDDGVLMGYAFDPTRNATDLLLLDAQTLDTVAAVHLPARVPHGFHGNWIPADITTP